MKMTLTVLSLSLIMVCRADFSFNCHNEMYSAFGNQDGALVVLASNKIGDNGIQKIDLKKGLAFEDYNIRKPVQGYGDMINSKTTLNVVMESDFSWAAQKAYLINNPFGETQVMTCKSVLLR